MKETVTNLSPELVIMAVYDSSAHDSRNMWGPRKYQDSENILGDATVVSTRALNAAKHDLYQVLAINSNYSFHNWVQIGRAVTTDPNYFSVMGQI